MKDDHLNRCKRELPATVRVVNNTPHQITQKTLSPNLGSVSQQRQTVQTQQSPGGTSTASRSKTPVPQNKNKAMYSGGIHIQNQFTAPTTMSHHKGPEGSRIPTHVSVSSFFFYHSVLQSLLWL